jgi:Histidine kinase-, DNA gyrase B-, and HSP90-like ATPase
MKSNLNSNGVSQELKTQREYTTKLKQQGFEFNLVVADAFIRGIRDIGYKSTATALDELLDNSMQASAQNIHVILGYGDSEKKPDKIAIIDDGHGMEPDMIRASMIWGGTHREDDRTGFGRYGYGLPSASVSQGRRFTVFSTVESGTFHAVTLDVDEVGKGTYTNSSGRVVVPDAEPVALPDWVLEYVKGQFPDGKLTHGTVVLIEKLDRPTWKTKDSLEMHLKQHFGITYRNFLRQVNLYVSGETVDPVDPLFLTPGARYYDLDDDKAQAMPPMEIRVKGNDGKQVAGIIKVRYSLLPPTFQLNKDKKGNNARLSVMKEHNGFVVLRNGRQIDVVTKNPGWLTFVNYDRNWKVEIDFPAVLDEEFSITTSKQQVVLSDRVWEILREAGVKNAIDQLRKDFRIMKAKHDTGQEQPEEKRASEQVMEQVEKHKTRRPAEDSIDIIRKSREGLKKIAEERAKLTGLPVEEAEHKILEEHKRWPYKVETETLPGAPFFRLAQVGGQKILYLNAAHRFYTDVYAGPDSTPRLRAGLELLLWVIGDCELDSTQERKRFYETERAEWSKMLNVALDVLNGIDSVEDELSARDAVSEDAPDQSPPMVQ